LFRLIAFLKNCNILKAAVSNPALNKTTTLMQPKKDAYITGIIKKEKADH